MIFIKRFLVCFGILGLLASCMETTGNTPATTQAPSTVNTAVLKGSYRFVSECSGSGSFLTSCQKSGFSINDSGGLSGAYYGFTDLNNPHKQYFISIGSLRSNTTTETLIGRGGGKVQITRYHANFSGRIVTDGVSRNVSGTAIFDPATSVITFSINSGSSFQGHRISRDGTTYWQRRSDEERAAEEQNLREIQQSRETAASVNSGLGIGTNGGTTSNAITGALTGNTGQSGQTTAFVPKANNCVKRTSTGGLKNVCSYPIVVAYCTQSPSSLDSCSGSNTVTDGGWITASGGRINSGESVNLLFSNSSGIASQSRTGISFGACDARQSRLNEGVAVRLNFNGETVSSFTCSL